MYKIVYIILYFGCLPNNFQLYLKSCKYNSTVDWLIFTDDNTEYDYPENVRVEYTSFDEISKFIAKNFEYDIVLDRPYKLCTYKPAYGQIFKDYIKEYDFWGHCDADMLWGDIRKFYTDEVLSKYDKIGVQGHSTLYRNNDEVNSRYKLPVNGVSLFEKEAKSKGVDCFDEVGMKQIYEVYGWDFYNEVHFAHPSALNYNFKLKHLPDDEEYKNKSQVFTWENGKLERVYVHNGNIYREEFMYIHFFRRVMDICASVDDDYLILPHKIVALQRNNITVEYINENSKESRIKYYMRLIRDKRRLGKFKLNYIVPSVISRIKKFGK